MPGIPREFAEHSLQIKPGFKPIKQTMRRFSDPKRDAIEAEVDRLRAAKFIRELKKADWIANPVLVDKKNSEIKRMCVDFTSLNKCCPKDHFPLPRIDQIIDSTAGCARLSFLDAYSGYHQIRMKKEDEEKTAFITPLGVFCYTTMPFGLKNAGATYQRMMQNCLAEQIGKNVQVYVDDIVVKTQNEDTLIKDLQETFNNLNRYNIKLNPKKCTFGVPAGQLLGYLVSARGIEADPEKIQAIITMKRPTKLHEVQQLAGRVAALSRFISKLGERALPFYKLMKRAEKFEWMDEADAALQDLKKMLTSPPILVAPRKNEPLYLYVSATNRVVSTVLVVDRMEEGHSQSIQRPVYYVSEVLSPSKQRYPQYQKLAYAVFMTSRKLAHYFSNHPITVVNKSAIGDVLTNPNATGRVAKWLIELGPLGIKYEHPKAIKAQVLPDFHTEWIEAQLPGVPDVSNSWTMYFDGSKKNEGAGAGVVLISPKGDKLRYVLQMGFEFPSNNEAEYEALIHGMRMAKAMGCTRLMIYGDSKLVVQQTMKACDSIADNMTLYHDLYNIMEGNFEGCELRHIGRESNEEADKLANIASTKAPIPPGVFFERIEHRSIDKRPSASAPATGKGNIPSTTDPPVEVLLIEPTWTQPFLAYILRNELPEDINESRRIIRRAKSYTIINGELYKRNTSGIFQRCIAFEDGKDLLRDIHAGTCGHHAGSRSIVAKAFRAGFYWPTALSDAEDIVKRCIGCQKFATRPHAPASALKTIPLAWPFAQWGLDMVGPLKKSSKGGHTHLLVAVDKFTKWIEAIPITSSTASTAVRFIQSIIYRYGVMDSIITDNGTNFTAEEFQSFCKEQGVKLNYASVAHPQSNGQVEKANALVCSGIKKRLLVPLKRAAGAWVEELDAVLWSLRTTPNASTQYTPFFMVYGSEAVLPSDVKFQAPRVEAYEETDANKALKDANDLLEEARNTALARTAVYQQDLRNYHSRRLRTRSFMAGDLVLREKQKKVHKLASPWEGPYIITEVISDGGAYRLKDAKTGEEVSNPWNVAHLRRFYA